MRAENTGSHRTYIVAAVLAALTLGPETAWAYAGPGSGLTVIGAAVAFIGAVLLAIVGFVWYPIKRMLRRKTRRQGEAAPVADSTTR